VRQRVTELPLAGVSDADGDFLHARHVRLGGRRAGLVEGQLPLLVVEALHSRNGGADTARVERDDGVGVAELLEVLAVGPQVVDPADSGAARVVSTAAWGSAPSTVSGSPGRGRTDRRAWCSRKALRESSIRHRGKLRWSPASTRSRHTGPRRRALPPISPPAPAPAPSIPRQARWPGPRAQSTASPPQKQTRLTFWHVVPGVTGNSVRSPRDPLRPRRRHVGPTRARRATTARWRRPVHRPGLSPLAGQRRPARSRFGR
jgi:hypothetical protein